MDKMIKMSYAEHEAMLRQIKTLKEENASIKGFLEKSGPYELLIRRDMWEGYKAEIKILHWDQTVLTQHVKKELNIISEKLALVTYQLAKFKSKWFIKLYLKLCGTN